MPRARPETCVRPRRDAMACGAMKGFSSGDSATESRRFYNRPLT